MRIQNNSTFCGKVIPPSPDVINVSHLVTRKVKNAMRLAPDGSTLQVKDGKFLDRCRVVFTAPNKAFTVVIRGIKRAINEGHVIDLIKQGAAKLESRKPRPMPFESLT